MNDAERQRRLKQATDWLADNPDAPLMDKLPRATVVLFKGEMGGDIWTDDIAEFLGVPLGDVEQALEAHMERPGRL